MIISGREAYKRGYVKNLREPEKQIQPNGVDLSVEEIYLPITKPLHEKINEKDYEALSPLDFGGEKVYLLPNTPLLFRTHEIIDLHTEYGTVVGYVLPKSSWSRRGFIIHSALWDSGYKGRGTLLVVPSFGFPFEVDKKPYFCQIIIMEAQESSKKYEGNYQNEGLGGKNEQDKRD